MKLIRAATVLLVFATASSICSAQPTLGSVKREYLGQKVILNYPWSIATLSGGRYETDWNPIDELKGNVGTVIAVQLHDVAVSKVNALGQEISADNVINPHFDIVVRLDSGAFALTFTDASTIFPLLQEGLGC